MLVDKDTHQRETITKWPFWLALSSHTLVVNRLSKNREEEEEEEEENTITFRLKCIVIA